MRQQALRYTISGLTAVVLAAGQSQRLQPMTKDKPKAMLDIKGKTILERQIAVLNAAYQGSGFSFTKVLSSIMITSCTPWLATRSRSAAIP